MIKWLVAIRFRADRSKEECRRHWGEQHAPLALALPELQQYVQSHRVQGDEDIGNAPYDGFESLWFESEAAAKQALASAQMALLTADADHFADSVATKHFLAREIVLRDERQEDGALKLVTFNFRKPEMSPRTFQDYWKDKHGPLVLQKFAALRRYVQNHAVDSCYESGAEPDFDGVLEAWLASFEALSSGEGTADNDQLRADEANFLDPARFKFMLVRDQRRR